MTAHTAQASLAIPPGKPMSVPVHTLRYVGSADTIQASYSVNAADGAWRTGVDSGKKHKGDSRADIGEIDAVGGGRNV